VEESGSFFFPTGLPPFHYFHNGNTRFIPQWENGKEKITPNGKQRILGRKTRCMISASKPHYGAKNLPLNYQTKVFKMTKVQTQPKFQNSSNTGPLANIPKHQQHEATPANDR
jgi:hypothetical protein